MLRTESLQYPVFMRKNEDSLRERLNGLFVLVTSVLFGHFNSNHH